MNNNITEDYCSFEVSKLLKEKGFDIALPTWYDNDGLEGYAQMKEKFYIFCTRPTHALAIKWIRENFGIWIFARTVILPGVTKFESVIDTPGKVSRFLNNGLEYYNLSEEATEAALLYSLTNLI